MDDNWKKLFVLVGLTKGEMQTKETMDFIYDFVEKRGGIEAVVQEIELAGSLVQPPGGNNKFLNRRATASHGFQTLRNR